MHLSFQALVLAALSLEGALAQPAHRHQHKHRRDLADVLHERDSGLQSVDWHSLDWPTICAKPGACGKDKLAANEAAPVDRQVVGPSKSPVVPPSGGSSAPASSAVAPSSSPSSSSTPSTSGSSSGSSTGSCNSLASVWDKQSRDSSRDDMKYLGDGSPCPGGCTSAHGAPFSSFSGDKTTPANVGSKDSYRGNVGSTYGHNMFPLSDCNVSGHEFSITFTNGDSKEIYVAIWNKVGDDYNIPGRLQTGQGRNAFWKFPLAAGQSAAFAVQGNSQIAFSQACDRKTVDGTFDCTWGEADFGDLNTPNNGWSGYDRSSIPSGAGNTGLLTVCAEGHGCSSKEAHSFVSASQTDAGGDLSVPAGQPAHMKVTMGG